MIPKEERLREIAMQLVELNNDHFEFSDVYEDEDITEEFPDEEDWEKIHDLMYRVKITYSWEEDE